MNKNLLEASRQQLLTKTKSSDNYKDTSKGRNRYERRTRSKVASTVAQYNRIDMNELFKNDVLIVGIEVYGETSNYITTVKFEDVWEEVRRQVKSNNDKFDFRILLRSLLTVINKGDVYLNCTCGDFIYRQAYYATKDGYKEGEAQFIPSDITNPNDTKGGGCKHCALVLSNLDWIMKVASTINNYINYSKKYLQKNYAEYIFPQIYGTTYSKAVQLNLFDDGLLPTDQSTLDIVNRIGRDSGKFKVGNEYRFKKSDMATRKDQGSLFSKDDVDDKNISTNSTSSLK